MQQKITPKEVVIDGSKHPESAANAADAQKAGKPDTVTVDRAGAGDRRREALKGRSQYLEKIEMSILLRSSKKVAVVHRSGQSIPVIIEEPALLLASR